MRRRMSSSAMIVQGAVLLVIGVVLAGIPGASSVSLVPLVAGGTYLIVGLILKVSGK